LISKRAHSKNKVIKSILFMNRKTDRNRLKYSQYEEGKIKCPMCSGYYKKICSHVVQRHNMTSKDFKAKYGYNNKKGVMTKESREIARANLFKNYEQSVIENLLIKGFDTRVKKGQTFIHRPRGSKSHANK